MQTRRTFIRTSIAASSSILIEPMAGALSSKAPVVPVQREPVIYLKPGDAEYKAARQVFNATIATQPQMIARCASEEGVQQAMKLAMEKNWPVAVKSGGHSFEGFCLNDDGLVIDVSPMRELHLDEKAQILTAGAGCRLGDVNRYLLAKGRFLPAGSCETVGLAGLTLGGGYGMFARKWGLTCDHLRSVRMVDGTGKLRDSSDEPDLLWACKGGGNGNFGVVTRMKFQTREAPRGFSSWKFRMYKLDVRRATSLLETWFAATAGLPHDAFSAWVMNGSQVTILVTTVGSRDQKDLAAVCKKLGALSNRTTTAGPTAITKALTWYYGDPTPTFFKNCSAGYYKGMEDLRAALPAIFGQVLSLPGLIFQVNTLGGAIGEGENGAYPHREFSYLGEQQAFWDKPSQAASRIEAAANIREALAAAGIHRHYANYPDLAFKEWPEAYYGKENYARLQKLKAEYDPENRVRHAQSVRVEKSETRMTNDEGSSKPE